MDAALHDGYGDAADGAEDKLAGVANDGGKRPVGDVAIGDGGGGFDLGGEVAETGAEDDAEGRLKGGLGADVVRCGLGLLEQVGHLD